MNNGILEKLEKAHFVASEAQVESLANEMYSGATLSRRADGTYLRVLLAAVQTKVGKGRGKINTDAQSEALEEAHDRFYAAVMRGVTTPDVAADDGLEIEERQRRMLERNRRSSFARSAVSTVRGFVKAGGDLRGLVLDTVTKGELRSLGAPREPPDKLLRQGVRAQGALLRAAERMAKRSVSEARELLQGTIKQLQAAVKDLPQVAKPTAEVAHVTPPLGRPRNGRSHSRGQPAEMTY